MTLILLPSFLIHLLPYKLCLLIYDIKWNVIVAERVYKLPHGICPVSSPLIIGTAVAFAIRIYRPAHLCYQRLEET